MRFFFDWRAEGTMDPQRIFIERRYKPSQRLHNMINNSPSYRFIEIVVTCDLLISIVSGLGPTRIISNNVISYHLMTRSRFNFVCKTFSYLNTWFVQTMTECWLESWLSRTCSTKCIQIKSPVFLCSRVSTIHDRSCSDCVTANKEKKVLISNWGLIAVRTYSACASFEPLWYCPNELIGTRSFHSIHLSCSPNGIPRCWC